MRFYWFTLGALAVWRVTHLLQAEDGPWELVVRLRRAAGQGFWGELLDCFECLSVWVAAPFALLLGEDVWERVLLWPALSGAAILLERASARPGGGAAALYVEDQGGEHGLLRREEGGASDVGADGRGPET